MTHQCFDVAIDDDIAHVQLSRPERRNAMSPEFWDELPSIVRDIDRSVRARVVVISSTGPHFSAGLDVDAFLGAGGEASLAGLEHGAALYQTIRRMQNTFSVLEECRLPVLAAIQGGAIGGGVDLVTACDMRYATEDAFVTIFETNIGMTADVGTFPRLAKLIPEGVVRELAYTGRRMGAEEARAAGLFNRVFPDQETMLTEVMKIAREIASKAPRAVYGCKKMITYARDHPTADALDYVGLWNASMLDLEEIGEALAAGREKRPGRFEALPPLRTTTSGSSE